VNEGELDPRSARGDARKLLAEMYGFRRHDRRQSLVQIAAMEREIGRAVPRLDRRSERMIVGDLAADRVAVEGSCGRERDVAQARLDAEPAVDLHCVRALLNAGTDPRELLRLLVDLGADAALPQRRRQSEPADAGADDRDGGGGFHSSGILAALITVRQCGISFWM
jgi:hypothetical protein